MWASSSSALESWCCHGQITALECSAWEKERAASYRLLSHDSPWTIKKSKGSSPQSLATTRKPEPWWEAQNCVAAQSGSLQQQRPRGRRSPGRPCHGKGSLSCSSSKRPQTGCFGSLSHPWSPGKGNLSCFSGGENSAIVYHSEARYLLQICFSGSLFLLLSWCFFLFFYILHFISSKQKCQHVKCPV